MNSSFFSLHVASSGLFSARAGLQVVSHNISNASTEGFSRQFVELRASRPLATWNHRGMIGSGSEAFGIGQIRSFYLDQKFWAERGVLGQHASTQQLLSVVETVFNEARGTGISSGFDIFFARMQELHTQANDGVFRNNVLMAAESLARFINTTAQSLQRQQVNANTEVAMITSSINNIGLQISSLNERISRFEMNGQRANDLRDQRALLIDELSQFVNVEVVEREFNDDFAAGLFPRPEDRGRSDLRLSIRINGYDFINHFDVNLLETVPRSADPDNRRHEMDAPGLYDLRFANGVWFNIYSPTLQGQLRGTIDVRDGNSGTAPRPLQPGTPAGTQSPFRGDAISFRGIPFYMEQLNHLVRTFAEAMNNIHRTGFARNAESQSDMWFFTFMDGTDEVGSGYPDPADPATTPPTPSATLAGMNALNFRVNSRLRDDPYLLATSTVAWNEGSGGESNNMVVQLFMDLANDQSLFAEGSIHNFINAVSTQLGIDVAQATNFAVNYNDVTESINNQRRSVSGVSLNEEILAMIQFQQQFVAASRLMSAINDVYDNMINRMGIS